MRGETPQPTRLPLQLG